MEKFTPLLILDSAKVYADIYYLFFSCRLISWTNNFFLQKTVAFAIIINKLRKNVFYTMLYIVHGSIRVNQKFDVYRYNL